MVTALLCGVLENEGGEGGKVQIEGSGTALPWGWFRKDLARIADI
jgi:hypothetical protein